MVTPPGNSTGNQATSGGVAQRSIPTPFLTKTYQIVDDPSIDDVISWNEDGSAFIVWNPTIFARDLLPKYFKHNNLSSFVRQLNTYGFRKVAPDRWEFANDCFRRGEKRLLRDIQRRKTPTAQSPPSQPSTVVTAAAIPMTPPQSVSPTVSNDEQAISNSPPPLAIPTASVGNNNGAGWSSSSINNNSSNNNGGVDLIDENELLRRENLQLNRDLTNMKSLCSNIFALMSNYSNLPTTISAVVAGYTEIDMLRPMDLLQRDGEDGGVENAAETAVGSPTRLFGFEIGSKRTREEGSGGGGSVNLDDQMMVDVEVKSEPFDGGSGDLDGDDNDHCHQQAPWMRRFHRQREKMSNL